VLAALEALRAIAQLAERPQRSLEVVAFTSEEPTRFGRGILGSSAVVRGLTRVEADELRDGDGLSLSDALLAIGLDPEDLPAVRRPAGAFRAFVELHIEQGPHLERTANTIGIVTGIAGPINILLTLTGSANHAGSTPMVGRRDALLGACEIALAVESSAVAAHSGSAVGTVGSLYVFPGASNIIPGKVTLAIDVRDYDSDSKSGVLAAVHDCINDVSHRRHLDVERKVQLDMAPAKMDAAVCSVLREICDGLGLSHQDMVSAAYHDALNMAQIAPTAMLFIPSRAGISHDPAEWSDPQHIIWGTRVLAMTLMRLAND
jgi:N-carbamoyl-L-amino-acid hydrolase